MTVPLARKALSDKKERLLSVLYQCAPAKARWALRGGEDAVQSWLANEGVKDLDLWLHSEDLTTFCEALAPHVQGIISIESDPNWLRHVVLVMSDACGSQLLDISYGDLKVGGALTCPEGLVTTKPSTYGPVLESVSVVADLLLRKLMRGKIPRKSQLSEACSAWQATSETNQVLWCDTLQRVIGPTAVKRTKSLLDGSDARPMDRVAFVMVATWASLRCAGPALLIRRRRRIAPNQRERTLYKRPMAPVLLLAPTAVAAEELEAMVRGLGVGCVARASRLENFARALLCALKGYTVIGTQEQINQLPSIARSAFGAPILLNVADNRGARLRYLAATHRWYIDRARNALVLLEGRAGMEPSE